MKKVKYCDSFEDVECSHAGPPEGSGVYGVFLSEYTFKKYAGEILVYIGSSKNIRKRVMGTQHCYRKLLNTCNCLVYTKSIETSDYIALEKKLIKKYQPPLNKVGK